MARASVTLVRTLRMTAARLAAGAAYQWGHFGLCNCGNLVQALCGLLPAQIHVIALERDGDWEQLANAYCPTSGYAIDDVFAMLVDAGLTTDDIGHFEKLDDPAVLDALPGGKRWLVRNLREDVVAYLDAWASLLERDLTDDARAAA